MLNNSLSISKIISLSMNMINSVQKILPLYDEVKPLIKKLNDFKNNITKSNFVNVKNVNNQNIKEIKKEEFTSYSSPQFYI